MLQGMKGLLLALLVGLVAVLPATAGEVVVIPLKGEVSKAQFFFLRRALNEATERRADAVILDIDTYGGELDAAVKMQQALSKVPMRTVAYINPNAGSAGAMIAISTKQIFMAPISAIGAAAPVMASGEDLPKMLAEKSNSYFTAYFRGVATENGHNPDVAEAFIVKDKAVVIGGVTVHEAGKLLSLNAKEATRRIDGKPVLADGIAASLREVARQAGLTGNLYVVEPYRAEKLAFWLTQIAPLLIGAGLLGIWIELKSPGAVIPGVVGAICLALFFGGHYVGGLAGWEAPVLFVIGVILVIVELVFLAGGTIVVGLIGAALMLGAVVWAMLDRLPGGRWMPTLQELEGPMMQLGLGLALTALGAAALMRYLPKTSIYRRFVLQTSLPEGPSFPAQENEFAGIAAGDIGVADSILRPSGRGIFHGTPRDVISQGEFIEKGTTIRVVAVEGSRIIVERALPSEELGRRG